MPFYEIVSDKALLDLAPGMPRPLTVAVLDKPQERARRTTAALVSAFGYRDETERLEIEVPSSYVTDFASIPPWARAVVSPFGRHAKAAVLHDWLYAIGEDGRKDSADRVFLHAMQDLEVEDWVRDLMYKAVCLRGKKGYRRAKTDWPASFADFRTGERIEPPFAREEAFLGRPHGPRPI